MGTEWNCYVSAWSNWLCVRTWELLRSLLWFGSFLMCFPTFIRRESVPCWSQLKLQWMLRRVHSAVEHYYVRCVCQGLHCHERKERYHLKDPESIKQQYNLCEDMVPLNRFRIQYIQWSIVGFRGYRVLAAVAALKQAILYCFVFLLRTSSTLCSYHIQFPNFPCVYPYFWNVMACHGILA